MSEEEEGEEFEGEEDEQPKPTMESDMTEAVFVHQGNAIDYTPSSDLAAGTVVVIGDLIGVARTPLVADQLGSLAVSGVFDVVKQSGVALAAGAIAYWNNTTKVAVATDGSGANKRLGKVVVAALAGDATVRIRLD